MIRIPLFVTIFSLSLTACDESPMESKYKLWYEQPAEEWMTEALPIGNGEMGAMIFGSFPEDSIQITEKSLWSGGPHSRHYTFGIWSIT